MGCVGRGFRAQGPGFRGEEIGFRVYTSYSPNSWYRPKKPYSTFLYNSPFRSVDYSSYGLRFRLAGFECLGAEVDGFDLWPYPKAPCRYDL